MMLLSHWSQASVARPKNDHMGNTFVENTPIEDLIAILRSQWNALTGSDEVHTSYYYDRFHNYLLAFFSFQA
jgi:hypothetical protein